MAEDLFVPSGSVEGKCSFFGQLSESYAIDPKTSITNFRNCIEGGLGKMMSKPYVVAGEYKMLVKRTKVVRCYSKFTDNDCSTYSRNPSKLDARFKHTKAKENGFNFEVELLLL